jgi:hypothetical protein
MAADKKLLGLFSKFIVHRTDRADWKGGKHEGCQYFVLDATHDPRALPALRAYAESCRKDGYDALASDLEGLAAARTEETRHNG